jgi:hypothetical protein
MVEIYCRCIYMHMYIDIDALCICISICIFTSIYLYRFIKMPEKELTPVQVNTLEKMRQTFGAIESYGLPLNDATFMRYSIYVFICIYINIHLNIRICDATFKRCMIYIFICMYIHINKYMYIYIYIFACIHLNIRIYSPILHEQSPNVIKNGIKGRLRVYKNAYVNT